MMSLAGVQLWMALGLVASSIALTPNTFLNNEDIKRLEDLFEGHLTARRDLQSVHYAALGAKVIGKTVSSAQVGVSVNLLFLQSLAPHNFSC